MPIYGRKKSQSYNLQIKTVVCPGNFRKDSSSEMTEKAKGGSVNVEIIIAFLLQVQGTAVHATSTIDVMVVTVLSNCEADEK